MPMPGTRYGIGKKMKKVELEYGCAVLCCAECCAVEFEVLEVEGTFPGFGEFFGDAKSSK